VGGNDSVNPTKSNLWEASKL